MGCLLADLNGREAAHNVRLNNQDSALHVGLCFDFTDEYLLRSPIQFRDRDRDFEYTIGELRRGFFSVSSFGKRDGTVEFSVVPFQVNLTVALLFCLQLPFSFDFEKIARDSHPDVFLL